MRADIHNHAVPESVVEFYEREPSLRDRGESASVS